MNKILFYVKANSLLVVVMFVSIIMFIASYMLSKQNYLSNVLLSLASSFFTGIIVYIICKIKENKINDNYFELSRLEKIENALYINLITMRDIVDIGSNMEQNEYQNYYNKIQNNCVIYLESYANTFGVLKESECDKLINDINKNINKEFAKINDVNTMINFAELYYSIYEKWHTYIFEKVVDIENKIRCINKYLI